MIDAEAAAGTTAPAILKKLRADTLLISADCLLVAGRFSEALPLCEENAAYYESIGDTPKVIDCLIQLGLIFFQLGLSDKALAVARRVQSLTPRDAHSLVQLGYLLDSLKLHGEALTCAHKALECEEKGSGKNTLRYAGILERIGTGYSYLDQFDATLSRFHRARSVREALFNYYGRLWTTATQHRNCLRANKESLRCAGALHSRRGSLPCGCKRCYYCSKARHTADWKAGHKTECNALRGRK